MGDNHSEMSISLGGFRSGSASQTDVVIEISHLTNRIVIRLPFTAVTGIYSKAYPDGLELTTDPRLFCRPGMQIDKRALYSLFQFGALIPPLTPWCQITRLVPGNVYEVSGKDLSIGCRRAGLCLSPTNPTDLTLPVHRQCEELAAELDRTLQQLCPDRRPVILFSGGIDSGLLAARAAAMEWRETLLVNCQMGSDDSESVHAEAMANQLGLSFERIPYSTDKLEEYFSTLGDSYLLPFGDLSTYPTFLLAKEIIDRHQDRRVALDGTGADGAFGLVGNAAWWRRISRMPRFVCKLGGFVYKASKMWMRPDSRVGRLLRILYSSAQMPSMHASIASNPLNDIAYHVPGVVRYETQKLLAEWLEGCLPWTRDLSSQRLSMMDLILICCGIFAQKDKTIFDASPIEVRYPFLEPSMVRLALERAVYWPGAEHPKSPLKNLLAQHVPREMVFRPKNPFTPPIKELFQSAAFLKAVDHMLEPTALTSFVLDRDCIRSLHRCLKQGQHLPVETSNFIWTAVFTNLWLEQVYPRESRT
jgi:asparagine synthetase B (glutamine-hydrolysing)